MKLLSILALTFSLPVFAGYYGHSSDQEKEYEITFTNLTKGQPLTPAVAIAQNGKYKLFTLGEEASSELKYLATDGKTDLAQAAEADKNVKAVATGSGLTFPGQSSTVTIKASGRSYLSFVSMLAKTNDAFVANLAPIPLSMRVGKKKSVVLRVFDAGAEDNNELQSYIPAFGNAEVGTETNEGFVHFHTGLQGVGDQDLSTDAFANIAAKITIKRIK